MICPLQVSVYIIVNFPANFEQANRILWNAKNQKDKPWSLHGDLNLLFDTLAILKTYSSNSAK